MPNVIGIFEDSSQAHQAIERMTKDRVESDQIGLLARDAEREKIKEHAGGTGTGAAVDAAADTLVGALSKLGVPQEEAANYQEQVRQGKVLVTVRAADDTEADRVANLMEVEGAVEIEGAGARGNVEAAPGYEGARAETEGDLLKSPRSSAPGRKTSRGPDHDHFRSPGGRIRIFRGT